MYRFNRFLRRLLHLAGNYLGSIRSIRVRLTF